MKKKIKIYGFLVTIFTIGFLIIFINFTKPDTVDVSRNKNVDRIPLEKLVGMFVHNEEEATSVFIEQVIEVEGVIKEISFLNDRHTIILNKENFTHSFVICDMSPIGDTEINEYAVGDTVILRGVFKGYLLDVIMLNCIPINEKTK